MQRLDHPHNRSSARLRMLPLIAASWMLAAAGPVAGQTVTASLELGGAISGVDQDDATAMYYFGVGYGDETGSPTYFAFSSIAATDLSQLTTSALLSTTYNNLESQLPLSLQGDLTLSANALYFSFPDSVGDATVQGYSTDSTLSYSKGLATTADPTFTISPPERPTNPKRPPDSKFPVTLTVTVGGKTYTGHTGGSPTSTDVVNLLEGVDGNGNPITNPDGDGDLVNGTTVYQFTDVTKNGNGEILVTDPTLTKITSATGVCPIDITPEPSTLTLLALGALAMLRRRRS